MLPRPGRGIAPVAALGYGDAAMPEPMRAELESAAADCRSVTIRGGADRADPIKLVAFELAGQFRRLVTIEVNGRDVVVAFYISAA